MPPSLDPVLILGSHRADSAYEQAIKPAPKQPQKALHIAEQTDKIKRSKPLPDQNTILCQG